MFGGTLNLAQPVCTADYQAWPVQPRRARSASRYVAPECGFDAESSYRLTYVTPPAAGRQVPVVVRPTPAAQSLPLMTSDAPFDARTNYRDEFTGRRRCSIKYLTVPNSSHLRHCACAISQSVVRRCLLGLSLIHISEPTRPY